MRNARVSHTAHNKFAIGSCKNCGSCKKSRCKNVRRKKIKVSDVRPVPSGPVTPFYFLCPPNLLCLLCPKKLFRTYTVIKTKTLPPQTLKPGYGPIGRESHEAVLVTRNSGAGFRKDYWSLAANSNVFSLKWFFSSACRWLMNKYFVYLIIPFVQKQRMLCLQELLSLSFFAFAQKYVCFYSW